MLPPPISWVSEEARRRHKLRNLFHSLLLLGGMGFVLAVTGWALWGEEGAWWTVLGGLLAFLLSPGMPPEWVMRLYGARRLHPAQAPELFLVLEELARRAELPATPALWWVPSPILNAFAVGTPERAAVAVTDGLVRTLTLRELTGVLAHEISHIRNRDLWLMQLADVMSRFVSVLSWFGQLLLLVNLPLYLTGRAVYPWFGVLVMVFAPTLMALLQLALSRAREYDADLDAAGLTGDPLALVSALEKLERHQGRFWEEILFPGRRIPEPSLLRTHPPTEERIRRLLELVERAPQAHSRWQLADAPPQLAGGLPPVLGRPRFRRYGFWY